jgi:hypothetical protein
MLERQKIIARGSVMSRIEDYIQDENGKEDLFEFDEGYWSVPCGMCENRHLTDNGFYCRKCRHYAE